MSNIETFVLVEMSNPAPHPASNALAEQRPDSIKRIVRTYESRERANQDLELLQEAMPAARFNIQSVEFIDR